MLFRSSSAIGKTDKSDPFRYKKSADFGNQPRLLGSRGGLTLKPDHASGTLLPGDRLYLMTDALAQWFLHAHESEKDVASVLSAAEQGRRLRRLDRGVA